MIKKSPESTYRTLLNMYNIDYNNNTKPLYGLTNDAKYKTTLKLVKKIIDNQNNPIIMSQANDVRPMQYWKNKDLLRKIKNFEIKYVISKDNIIDTGVKIKNVKASEILKQKPKRKLVKLKFDMPKASGKLEPLIPNNISKVLIPGTGKQRKSKK